MMKRILCLLCLSLLTVAGAEAHSVEYQVLNKGISARFFFLPDEPASYSSFQVFGPGDTIAYLKGRTDKNGVVSFLPDRPGKWVIKVVAESDHGGHTTTAEIQVNENLLMDSVGNP